jgi:TonB family protein
MSANKSLEEQGIATHDSSSKFIGVSLIFHALLVLLIVYLNLPAIKQKFNPEPESVAIELKEPTPAPAEVAKTVEPAAPKEKEILKPVAKTEPPKPVAKDNQKLAKMRIEEFKEEEKLTSTNIPTPKRTPKAKSSKQPAVAKQSTKATTTENESEVLVPKATITEITETEFGDDGIPLPEIVDAEIPMFSTVTTETLDTGASSASGSSAAPERTANLQQMARSELVEETVEENSLRTVARPTPDQIRSVSNLRQRPGNPLPSYSDFERLRRHEGQVTYLAYVTAEGRLKDFILTESSGHSNLDQKTLSSLKGWRFYPGQEGWVEIPQVWVLSGQPEELPSQLRR